MTDEKWFDTFTPEHYEAAVEYLRSLDTVGCVVTHDGHGYVGGELYIHTNYCTTEYKSDLDAFGARLISAGVVRADDEGEFECTHKHGDCFEICIDFCTTMERGPPDYLEERYGDGGRAHSVDHWILNNERDSKVFDADFSVVDWPDTYTVPEKHR